MVTVNSTWWINWYTYMIEQLQMKPCCARQSNWQSWWLDCNILHGYSWLQIDIVFLVLVLQVPSSNLWFVFSKREEELTFFFVRAYNPLVCFHPLSQRAHTLCMAAYVVTRSRSVFLLWKIETIRECEGGLGKMTFREVLGWESLIYWWLALERLVGKARKSSVFIKNIFKMSWNNHHVPDFRLDFFLELWQFWTMFCHIKLKN